MVGGGLVLGVEIFVEVRFYGCEVCVYVVFEGFDGVGCCGFVVVVRIELLVFEGDVCFVVVLWYW